MANTNYSVTDLTNYIKEVFNFTIMPDSIKKQMLKFMSLGITPKEIARCICYVQEVKKEKLDPRYGIWFVTNVLNEAAEYFKQLELDQQAQIKEAQKIVEYQDNNIIFNIKSLPHKKRQPIQLDMEDIEIGEIPND